MESEKIFEISNKELHRILKETSTDEIRIDLTKLDSTTKGLILSGLRSVVLQRTKELEKVIFGVK